MKKGVLILNYDPNAPNFEQTIWGIPPDQPGRLVRGVVEALEIDVGLVVIAGGSRRKLDGKLGAEIMKEFLYRNLTQLQDFTIYPMLQDVPLAVLVTTLKAKLDRILVVKETASNTIGNIEETTSLFLKAGITKITIVTSPDHFSRSGLDAVKIWRKKGLFQLAANVSVAPSVTLYSDGDGKTPPERAKMENVIILEPPSSLMPFVQRITALINDSKALAEIDAVLKRYGK